MPSTSIRLKPGVDTLATPALNEAGISASNLIRFRGGLVEKRGGWSSYQAGLGFVPRALCPGVDVDGSVRLAVAGQNGAVVIQGGAQTDIAPRSASTTPPISVSTQSGSATITVTDPNFSPAVGDSVFSNNPIAVGGVLFAGMLGIGNVTAVLSSTQYQVQLGSAATSTVTNGGVGPSLSTTAGSTAVNYVLPGISSAFQVGGTININYPTTVGGITLSGSYLIAALPDANTVTFQCRAAATATATASLNGGLAAYSYTLQEKAGTALRGSPTPTADWTLANYGTDLVACFGGPVLRWSKTSGYLTLAPLANSPGLNRGIFVADAQQMIVSYGASVGGYADRNYVAWCDAGNPTVWTAAGTNQAGSYRLPTGSGIVGGGVADGKNLLWTDVDVWAMSYIGYPLVWGFNKLATGCGLAAQNAWTKLGGAIYWMSQNEFWMYNGASVVALPCTVRDKIFGNIAPGMAWKVRAGANSQFNEVMWFYPSAGGNGENDSYVCFNPVEGTWDYGTMARSAWADQSVLGAPVGADPSGNVYLHETSPDAAGQPLQASFTTGWTLIQEGEAFAFVDLIRPDINFPTGAGTVQVSVLTCAYTGDAPTVAGPFSITAATEFINTRCRGRYVALRFASVDLGSFWRLGRVQLRFAPAGRR